jgi:uncharacterized membrane protein
MVEALGRVMSARTMLIAAWCCHGVLLAAAMLGLLTASFDPGVRGVLAVSAAAPLLLAIPGLRSGRRYTFQWLALVLVGFAGAAAVEVVASLGRSVLASAVLLAALIELALLFVLSRSRPAPRPARRG